MLRPWLRGLAGLLASLAWSLGAAQPAPQPAGAVDGQPPLRIWGHGRRGSDELGGLIRAWSADIARLHPGLRIEATLRGDATAIGGLYTGAADLALMHREPLASELDGYQSVLGEQPFKITFATGSLDRGERNPAPVFFVNRRNPLRRLSLAQLDGILGADHRRGPMNLRTWGDLGLRGGWAKRPITVYLPALSNDLSQSLQTSVMSGSRKWTPQLREFGSGAEAIAALARDPAGLAIANWNDRRPAAAAVALAAQTAGSYVLPSRQALQRHEYPLTRGVAFFMRRTPGQALAPGLEAWLRYVLSPEGQRAIEREGGYLPLTPERAQQELARLP